MPQVVILVSAPSWFIQGGANHGLGSVPSFVGPCLVYIHASKPPTCIGYMLLFVCSIGGPSLLFFPTALAMSACSEVVRYAMPSLCLSSTDLDSVSKLAEGLHQFLRLRAERFVRGKASAPVAEVLVQDGTPLRTTTVHTTGVGPLRVCRRGRAGREWLLQRVFLIDNLGNKLVSFTYPREMKDRTAPTHHQAGVDLWPGGRPLGHDGLLISHGVWDRAVLGPCSRMMQQRNAAFVAHQALEAGEGDAEAKSLWHWTTASGCTAHDFSNSLRWSNLQEFGSRDMMKRMWVVIESLRNSLDQFIGNLAPWLAESLDFRDFVGEVELRVIWGLLGVSGERCATSSASSSCASRTAQCA